LNQLLLTDHDPGISGVKVYSASLLKSVDMSVHLQTTEDRDLLRSRADSLQLLPRATLLMASYKVLMKGIQPYTVDLVGEKDEAQFIEDLRWKILELAIGKIYFVDFEPREDLTRTSTICYGI
jgi:hypothetical protein